MMTQPTLFGDTPPAPPERIPCPHCHGHGTISALEPNVRATDPATSRDAGARNLVDASRFHRDSQQAAVLMALAEEPGTAQEVALRVLRPGAPLSAIEGPRRRVSSLRRLGLISDTGERRTNPGSTSPSIVWAPTVAGLETIDRLYLSGWSV